MGIEPSNFESAQKIAQNFLAAKIVMRGELSSWSGPDNSINLKNGDGYEKFLADYLREKEIVDLMVDEMVDAGEGEDEKQEEYYKNAIFAIGALASGFIPRPENSEAVKSCNEALAEFKRMEEERILPKAVQAIRELAEGKRPTEKDRRILAQCYTALSRMLDESQHFYPIYNNDLAAFISKMAEGFGDAQGTGGPMPDPTDLVARGADRLQDPNRAESAVARQVAMRQDSRNEISLISAVLSEIRRLHDASRGRNFPKAQIMAFSSVPPLLLHPWERPSINFTQAQCTMRAIFPTNSQPAAM